MKYFRCCCNNTLFFENSVCLNCQREVGWCPVCENISTMLPAGDEYYTCGNSSCGARVKKCTNFSQHNVCNRMTAAGNQTEVPAQTVLCDYCRFTKVIPDLSVEGNYEKWYRLEVAKRRLLYLLDRLHLPYGTMEDSFELPLSFDFKDDETPDNILWRVMGQVEKVYTGHANGKITINIQEADPVERERMRVNLGEPQRTLTGHFRHEIGHYYWQLLVQNKDEENFKQIFGDHENPGYNDALKNYYNNGPAANWQSRYISAYASMHPWEDFAETWGAYLDMVSVLETSANTRLLPSGYLDLRNQELNDMVTTYLDLGIKVNEVNRALGLTDVLPEIFSVPVIEKMRYIHNLVLMFSTQGR